MRLLVCAGMTGGGIIPALAVLQALEGRVQQVMWVGSQSPMDAFLLQELDLNFQGIPAAGLHGVGFQSIPGNILRLLKGWRASKQIVRQFEPHVVFYTGGYIGVPMALAAALIPSLVFVPDIEPGFAHQIIMRKASLVAVSTPESVNLIRSKFKPILTGYPLRSELLKWHRGKARHHFSIPENDRAILVFGGSKGARSINRALAGILNNLLHETHIIHISGTDNWQDVLAAKKSLPHNLSQRYHAFPFLNDDMGAAFAAADLTICRSGASILGELPAFGLPAILVPYPHAWRYQIRNAQYLVRHGGAVMLEDSALEARLFDQIVGILRDRSRLVQMRKAMHQILIPGGAEKIADLLVQFGNQSIQEEKNHG